MEVLHDILLYKRCSHLVPDRLFERVLVDIGLRQETTVAWNVLGDLLCSHCQLVHNVGLLGRFFVQNITRVVALLSERLTKFCFVIASWRWVGLSVDWPKRASRHKSFSLSWFSGSTSISCFPVLSRSYILWNAWTSCFKSKSTLCAHGISAHFGWVEKLRVMCVFIVDFIKRWDLQWYLLILFMLLAGIVYTPFSTF